MEMTKPSLLLRNGKPLSQIGFYRNQRPQIISASPERYDVIISIPTHYFGEEIIRFTSPFWILFVSLFDRTLWRKFNDNFIR